MYQLIFAIVLCLLSVISQAATSQLAKAIQVNDLQQFAAKAKQLNVPILLIVSQHHCPFCVRLKEEIIFPMQISGDYDDKVMVAEILLDSDLPIIDFKGQYVSPQSLASSYKVWLTPTLLFLDENGREVHKRMLGVNTIEMYGYYLDQSIDGALNAIRENERSYIASEKDIRGDAPGADQM